MKKLLITLSALSTLILAGTVNAADAKAMEALAQKNGCLACHSVDKKVLGPSYKDVAAKYKADKSAEAKLVEKVMKGSTGAWGSMPMPAANAQVKEDDVKAIVNWIMSL
jgi:cytochrome c